MTNFLKKTSADCTGSVNWCERYLTTAEFQRQLTAGGSSSDS